MRILVPLDNADFHRGVFPALRRFLAVAPESDVCLLTVLDPRAARALFDRALSDPSFEPDEHQVQSEAEARERLAAPALAQLGEIASAELSGRVADCYVEWAGKPADGILRAAEDLSADVIVMASRRRGRVAGLIVGSVTQAVIHGSGHLVLVATPE